MSRYKTCVYFVFKISISIIWFILKTSTLLLKLCKSYPLHTEHLFPDKMPIGHFPHFLLHVLVFSLKRNTSKPFHLMIFNSRWLSLLPPDILAILVASINKIKVVSLIKIMGDFIIRIVAVDLGITIITQILVILLALSLLVKAYLALHLLQMIRNRWHNVRFVFTTTIQLWILQSLQPLIYST